MSASNCKTKTLAKSALFDAKTVKSMGSSFCCLRFIVLYLTLNNEIDGVVVLYKMTELIQNGDDGFLVWTVSSLKDFLPPRGLKQTGRKSDLVQERLELLELTNAPIKFSQK